MIDNSLYIAILLFALIIVLSYIEYWFFKNIRSNYIGIPILFSNINNYKIDKALQINRSQIIACNYKSKGQNSKIKIFAKCIGVHVFIHFTHPKMTMSLTTGMMINKKTGKVRVQIPVMIIVYHVYLILLLPFLAYLYGIKDSGIEYMLVPFLIFILIMLKIDLNKYSIFDKLLDTKKILTANKR